MKRVGTVDSSSLEVTLVHRSGAGASSGRNFRSTSIRCTNLEMGRFCSGQSSPDGVGFDDDAAASVAKVADKRQLLSLQRPASIGSGETYVLHPGEIH